MKARCSREGQQVNRARHFVHLLIPSVHYLPSGYPTLLLFRAGSKQQPIMYDGDRSESDMLVWLARNAQHSRLNVKDLMEKLKNLMSGGGVKDAKMAKTSVLEEL